jgi:allophanate hydrolase
MAEPGRTPGVGELLAGYEAGTLRPETVLREAYAAIERRGADSVWPADGEPVKGFLCEAHAVQGAEDISAWGGWRAYRARPGGNR